MKDDDVVGSEIVEREEDASDAAVDCAL